MHNRSKADHDALTYHPQARWMPGGRQPVVGMGARRPSSRLTRASAGPKAPRRHGWGYDCHLHCSAVHGSGTEAYDECWDRCLAALEQRSAPGGSRRRVRINDKTRRRMTSRKTSLVAQQLAGVRAQASLSANSAGHGRACDVGEADSWYWKHGPDGVYLCCSSGGDEACTHLF